MISPDKVFANLESVLNSNEQMLVNKREVEIVWAVRVTNKTATGFAKIDNTLLPFRVTVEDGVGVRIGDISFTLKEKTVEVALEEIEADKR
ncbi:hypothetical protein [Stygiolobus caldivivus]|uniref:Uncharacterized protein n=1 Tax=Stygiolobus caldivivus TaxID=2824673 RepID=A0A8D5U7M5_9CREN|nr:hypothetical protein [Stygiolobus caldivivus]BCU70818.1 hypothetical protein KN1_21150 [Stygiolobus caldivivus]